MNTLSALLYASEVFLRRVNKHSSFSIAKAYLAFPRRTQSIKINDLGKSSNGNEIRNEGSKSKESSHIQGLFQHLNDDGGESIREDVHLEAFL